MCTAFPAEDAKYGHVKMHHGYTNVLGLGDSSTWKLPHLNRYIYMFLAPLLIPIITPLVAVGEYPGTGTGAGARSRAGAWSGVPCTGLAALLFFPSSTSGGCLRRKPGALREDRNFLRQPGRVERASDPGPSLGSHLLAGDRRQLT